MLRLLASISVLAVSAAVPALPALAAPQAEKVALATTQLPRGVTPTHYDLWIKPNADALTFEGKAKIAIDITEPTDTIVLNAVDLDFASVSLTGPAGTLSPKVTVDAAAQTATFALGREVPKGHYTLAADYTGRIGTQAAGLFALDYQADGAKRRALYTQFEAPDARRMFPSWDEPAYKATFTLSADVPAGEMAVSNMPVESRKPVGGGLDRVTFAQSPKMSTYLLFFGLGEFDRKTVQAGGAEIGVIAKKGDIAKADYALEAAAQILPWYNDYFGVAYPLPKLDNIAAPGSSQFFSAMENWGAIFTFEHTLLVDPAISTETDKQRIFGVAAHEMAHQRFGDLLTMSWWDDLWLNEGFASWMAGRTTEHFHPEWDATLDAVFDKDGAMGLDALKTSHPIVQHVETVEQISQAFDAITYSKGEAVLRMLEGYVGPDAWREGVRAYMKQHAYGNTVTKDLWQAVEAAAKKPIVAIAHDFTLQPGVPLIRVTAATCKDGATTLNLEQSEFTKDRPDKKPLTWRVPVIAETVGGEPVRTVVEGGKAAMSLPGCAPVVVNAGQTGYYRTLYTPELFDSLSGRFADLGAADQIGVMEDSYALGLSGLQPASDVLALIDAVPAGAKSHVWREAASVLAGLYDYADGDEALQASLRAFASERLSPVLAKLGWEPKKDEADTAAILRDRLIRTLGHMGDPKVVEEARRRFAARDTDASAIPSSLRLTIYGVVARNADAATWDALRSEAKAETSALARSRLYVLLGAPLDPALAKRALDLALTDEPGATNTAAIISEVGEVHPQLAFDFIKAKQSEVEAHVDASSRTRFVPRVVQGSHDPAMIAALRAYADAHIPASARRAADTAIAAIQNRIRVREDRLPEIAAWLKHAV
jgi:aminopeptidase N